MPKRVKVPGAFKFNELPENTVYVGRSVFGYPKSKWANPYRAQNYGHIRSIVLWMYSSESPMRRQFEFDWSELAGKDLACWCPPDKPCHADVLLYFLDFYGYNDDIDTEAQRHNMEIDNYARKYGYGGYEKGSPPITKAVRFEDGKEVVVIDLEDA